MEDPQLPPLTGIQPPSKSRLTVVDCVYHIPTDGLRPVTSDSRFSVEIQSDEQPYERRFKVEGPSWVPLDCGWIKEASMVVICNDEGRFLQVNPTREEEEQTRQKVLFLHVGNEPNSPNPKMTFSHWVIHPGQSFRGTPALLSKLWLKSKGGVLIRASVTAFPR